MGIHRKSRPINLVESLEERCLFAVALPSDNAIPLQGTFAFGDVNGDGKLDLAFASRGRDTRTGVAGWGVELFVNLGPGQLRQTVHFTAIPNSTLTGQACAVVGDVNGDGKNDIVVYVISRSAAVVPHGGVLLGDGKGNFKFSKTFDTVGMGPTYRTWPTIPPIIPTDWGLSLADLDGDGRKDLFIHASHIDAVDPNTGQPYRFKVDVEALPPPIPSPVTLYAMLGVAKGLAGGTFGDVSSAANPLAPAVPPGPSPRPPVVTTPQGETTYFHVMGAGDLNGDGKAEIVVQPNPWNVVYNSVATISPLTFNAASTINLPGDTPLSPQTVPATPVLPPLNTVLAPPPVTPRPLPIIGNLPKPGPSPLPVPPRPTAFAFLTDANRDGLADIAVLRGGVVYLGVNRSLLMADPARRPAFGWKQFTGSLATMPFASLPLDPTAGILMFVADLDGKGTPSMSYLVAGRPVIGLTNFVMPTVAGLLSVKLLTPN